MIIAAYSISLDGDVLEEVVVDLDGIFAVVERLPVYQPVKMRLLHFGQRSKAFSRPEVNHLDVVLEQLIVGVFVGRVALNIVDVMLVNDYLDGLVEVLVDPFAD